MISMKKVSLRGAILAWFLACLISAVAGVERGGACLDIGGLGTLEDNYVYDTSCPVGQLCYVVECDGEACGEGVNDGQFCWNKNTKGLKCLNECAGPSSSSVRWFPAPAGRTGCLLRNSESLEGGGQ